MSRVPIIVFIIACVEIIGLIKLGQAMGGTVVLGVILLTAVLGFILLQIGGRSALTKLAMNAFVGRLSLRELLRRELSLLLASVLLILPGLLSDAAGVVLLARHLLTGSRPSRPHGVEDDAIDIDYQVHNEGSRK